MAFSIIFVHFYSIEADIYESRASASGGLNYSRSRVREREKSDIHASLVREGIFKPPLAEARETFIDRKITEKAK